MMGYGKDCRYELHHPMSLGDVLAALFRAKGKRPHAEEAIRVLEREAVGDRPESAPLPRHESRAETNEARLQLK